MPFPNVTSANVMVDPLTGMPGGGWNYTHLAANGTTLVKTGYGVLHSVTVNTKGASVNTLTIDDALTATTPTIAVIDTTSVVGQWLYDIVFNTGLTIVLATGTAADVTIVWR